MSDEQRKGFDSSSNVSYPARWQRRGARPPGDNDLEARVKKLEDETGDIRRDLKALLVDSAEMKGMLRGMPSATAFGELKGRVESLPTTSKVAALLGVAVALVTIATKWNELTATFG